MGFPIPPPSGGTIVATNIMTLPIPPPTGGTIVATMGLIQEHNHPIHNIDPFNFEHILIDKAWLSDCDWMFDPGKSFEHGVS